MNNNIQRFIETIESPNTIKVVKYALKDNVDNIECYNLLELEQYILDLKPNSPKAITTICYVLRLYAKWLEEQKIIADNSFYQLVQSLDKNLLWKKSKPNAKKKFMSYEQYKNVVHEIGVYEEYNALYYEVLFRSIYEGIYNEDLSVLKNLRSSDIGNGIVTLHEDNGHSYKLKVSTKLTDDLKELALIDSWERKNRYGAFKVELEGVYSNSVFKIEHRNTNSSEGAYKFSYYAKLRKISKEYLEYNMPAMQIYISGITHRIKIELEKYNISLEEAFINGDTINKKANMIISKELIRCNYDTQISNFREMVKGHLDIF